MTPTNGGKPRKIRVSLGSAIVLQLLNGKLDAAPTTAYLMTYKEGKCNANCAFCPQARESSSRADMLSRVSWPTFPTEKVMKGISKAVASGTIRRVCIQALNYPEVFVDLTAIIKAIKQEANVPTSVSCQPLSAKNVQLLAEAGAERIGIPLDAATKEIFDNVKGAAVKGPYNWERQWQILDEATKIFGKGMVSTHLIVGLGETEKEMISTIQRCVDMGVLPALFAFTPIAGTMLESISQPAIENYRRIQVARHLIVHGISRYENMAFSQRGEIINFGVEKATLAQIIETGKPFLTSGCPNCNRPYYNEKPSGSIYNYPRLLNREEIVKLTEDFTPSIETY
ncbi:MAG: radical SAM protein [Candidatus Bathyarchaeales archaeon]